MDRETHDLFDRIFKLILQRTSDRAVVNFINGLFGAGHPPDSAVERPNPETVWPNLSKTQADLVLGIGASRYLVEAQAGDDETIAMRIFRYSLGAAAKTQEGHVLTVRLPEARIIYWEHAAKTPDLVVIRLQTGEKEHYDYKVPTVKFLDHTIAELEAMNLGILLPFYVLKLRKKVAAARAGERRRELFRELPKLREELAAAIGKAEKTGLIAPDDRGLIVELEDTLSSQLYERYDEYKEAKAMADVKERKDMPDIWEVLDRIEENAIVRAKYREMERKLHLEQERCQELELENQEMERELQELRGRNAHSAT
jgi:hypothetical protein